ncbi:hypothetical protein [Actinoplanes sp. URMC 104]|uniref:hypothetical protein n=1 Tax=Actinoplanes sp. URMC 104 TaxID=3423409 RepID=UPI003F1A3D04
MTATPLPLIKDISPVLPGMPARGRPPNVGVVYATNSGELFSFPGFRPMTFREQLRTAYRRRYDIDMSHHRRRAWMKSTPLPARGDYYEFVADVEVGFRVHDPEEIVRRNITEATRVVYSHLADEFRRITRKYDIELAELAESEIISRFDGDDVLDDGITIFYVAPRLVPNPKAIEYLRDRKQAESRILVEKAQHKAELEAAIQRGRLDRMRHEFEREMAKLQLDQMGDGTQGAYEIVRLHLARHPDDAQGALKLLLEHRESWMDHQERFNQHTLELFQSMLRDKVVQAADLQMLLPQLLAQLGIVPREVPLESTLDDQWDQPPVAAASTEASEPITVAAGHGWNPAYGHQPVYLVVDESAGAEQVIPHVNTALPYLLDALATDAAAPAIRLAVLGYAAHVTERLPYGEVTPDLEAPHLTAGEPAAYPLLFAELADHLDAHASSDEPANDPLIYLICASAPDNDNWTALRHRLTNREAGVRPAVIMAFGFGNAPPDLIAGIASDPGNAFTIKPGGDPVPATGHCADFIFRDLLARLDRPPAERRGPAESVPQGFTSAARPS